LPLPSPDGVDLGFGCRDNALIAATLDAAWNVFSVQSPSNTSRSSINSFDYSDPKHTELVGNQFLFNVLFFSNLHMKCAFLKLFSSNLHMKFAGAAYEAVHEFVVSPEANEGRAIVLENHLREALVRVMSPHTGRVFFYMFKNHTHLTQLTPETLSQVEWVSPPLVNVWLQREEEGVGVVCQVNYF
jgi:hypothetical protein